MSNTISIVDSHLHLWDPSHIPVHWLRDLPSLNRPHLPATLSAESKTKSKISSSFVPPNIEAIVYVETDTPASYTLLETEWVAKLANEDKRVQAIVANAPVEDGKGIKVYLDALLRSGSGADGKQLVKGVRRLIQSEDTKFCVQPGFVEGVKLLGEYGLSFDICCRPQHLENVILLVSQCPDTQFVLDHMGKPCVSASDPGFEKWKEDIGNLAKLPNVYCKLSGIVTEAHTFGAAIWKPEDLERYVSHVIQVFGSLRVMFGSDWPVVKLAEVGYNDWLDMATTLTSTLTQEEKQQVWSGNAKKFYKL